MSQQSCVFETHGVNPVLLNYLVFLPKNYTMEPDKKWPLILFLHGKGERGNNPELLKALGIPKAVEQNPDFEFIAVSPQCPEDTKWIFETDKLIELLDYVESIYNIDTSRIYLTGLSMGGHGTWMLAIQHPERFAAIAPICGHKVLENVCNLKDTPVWVFHGAKDPLISIEESQEMAAALKECGCDVQFTVYPDADHDSWTETYNNPKLYKWFLKHSKSGVKNK